MEEKGYIEVRVEGTVNGQALAPANVDISEIREMINDIETFLYPTRIEKSERPLISYKIEEGSAKHIFTLPITAMLAFNAYIGEIETRSNIDFLDYKRAEIIANFQKKAAEKNWQITLSTSASDKKKLTINKQTRFYNTTPAWISTELYLYGEIYEEGGINPNLHILTKQFGKLTVSATKQQLLEGEKKLYQFYGIKVSGKQGLSDKKPFDLKLEQFIEYNPVFNRSELELLIKKATPNLSKIDNVDSWLQELRGGING